MDSYPFGTAHLQGLSSLAGASLFGVAARGLSRPKKFENEKHGWKSLDDFMIFYGFPAMFEQFSIEMVGLPLWRFYEILKGTTFRNGRFSSHV